MLRRRRQVTNGPTTWDGLSTPTGFVLTQGNNNSTSGPELTDYATQCHGAGLQLQQTRGSRRLYGAPGHSMYNHIRVPYDPSRFSSSTCWVRKSDSV